MSALRTTLVVLAAVLVASASANTPGGSRIIAQARATVGGQPTAIVSNQVTTEVPVVCSSRLSPRSVVIDPIQSVVAKEQQEVSIPFRVTNTGNSAFVFGLAHETSSASAWSPASVAFYLDLQETGEVNPGDPVVTDIELEAGATIAMVMYVVSPPGAVGNLVITPRISCPEDVLTPSGRLRVLNTEDENDSFSRVSVLGAGDPVINTGISLASGPTREVDGNRVRSVEVTVRASNTGANATVPPGEQDAATVELPLDGTEGCFSYQSASSDDGAVEVLMGTSWLSAGEATLLVQSGVMPASRARAVRMRLAALAGGEVAELLALFDLNEGGCPDRLPSLKTEASVPGPSGYTTRKVGFSEIRPVRAGSLRLGENEVASDVSTAASPLHTVATVEPMSVGQVLSVGEERCYPVSIGNDGDEFDTFRLALNTTLSSSSRELVDLALKNESGLTIEPSIGLDAGETIDLSACITVLEPVVPFDVIARLTSTGGIEPLSARLRVSNVVASETLGILLEATPHGYVTAGSLVNFLATVRNDFVQSVTGVRATMGIVSVLGPDGAALEDAYEITAMDSGLVWDEQADALVWEAGNIEPGFQRQIGFQIRLSEDLPDGTRMVTLASAGAPGLGSQAVSPAVEHLVWQGGVTVEVETLTEIASPGGLADVRITIRNPTGEVFDVSMAIQNDALLSVHGVTRSSQAEGAANRAALSARLEPEGEEVWLVSLRVHPSAAGFAPGVVRVQARASAIDFEQVIERTFQFTVDPGALRRDQGFLMGIVFMDRNADGRFDPVHDVPIPAVRLVLADGRSVSTDANGRFAFRDLPIGWWRVQLDPETLPSVLAPSDWRTSDHSIRVWVHGVTRADAPLESPLLDLTWETP